MRDHVRHVLLTAAIVTAGCSSDSTNEGGTETPTPLLLAATAPALCSDSAGAWFKKDPAGPDSTIALVFPENPPDCQGSTHDFLRLKLKGNSLSRYPDGTLIANGDSVFISVKWVGNDSILFELKPSGLQFDQDDRAELKIEYDEVGDDLNHDGDHDEEDDDIERRLDIYRQEHPGAPFVRVGTGKIEEEHEIEAKLSGFSRFMIAY